MIALPPAWCRIYLLFFSFSFGTWSRAADFASPDPPPDLIIKEDKDEGIQYLSWSADGSFLISAGEQDVTIREAATGNIRCRFHADDRLSALALSNTPRATDALLAVATDQGFEIHSVHDGRLIKKIAMRNRGIEQLEWSPDGRYLATSEPLVGLKLWNTTKWKPIKTWNDKTRPSIYNFSFSRDSSRLATDGDGVRIYDLPSGRSLGVVSWDAGRLLSFLPDGKSVVESNGETTHVWDIATGKLLNLPDETLESIPLQTPGIGEEPGVAPAPGGPAGAPRGPAPNSDTSIAAECIGAGGTLIAVARRDKRIEIHETVTGKLLWSTRVSREIISNHRWPPLDTISIGPNGQALVVVTGYEPCRLEIWHLPPEIKP